MCFEFPIEKRNLQQGPKVEPNDALSQTVGFFHSWKCCFSPLTEAFHQNNEPKSKMFFGFVQDLAQSLVQVNA